MVTQTRNTERSGGADRELEQSTNQYSYGFVMAVEFKRVDLAETQHRPCIKQ